MTCWDVSQIKTSMGRGFAFFDCRCSMTAWIEFLSSSPMMYSIWLRMYGKVTSRWPLMRTSGIATCGPYARVTKSRVFSSQRSTISLALHRKKISPTASACGSWSGWACGKCQGELKVSVRARCCSAITLREIRCCRLVAVGTRLPSQQRTDRSMVFMNLSISGFMRPRTSSTPIARRGITVACSLSVSSSVLQYSSLSSSVRISGTRRNRSKARR
jgi:hypothetical protein